MNPTGKKMKEEHKLPIDYFSELGDKKNKTEDDIQSLVALHSIILKDKIRYATRPFRGSAKRLEISKEVGLSEARKIAKGKNCPYRDTTLEKNSLSDNYVFTN